MMRLALRLLISKRSPETTLDPFDINFSELAVIFAVYDLDVGDSPVLIAVDRLAAH